VPPLKEIRGLVLEAWKLEEARKATLAKAKTDLAAGGLKALGEVKTQEPATLKALGETGLHPAIRRALLDTLEGATTPLIWGPDGKLWAAKPKSRTPAEPLTFTTRRSLVEELQREGAQTLLSAELADLDSKGRAGRASAPSGAAWAVSGSIPSSPRPSSKARTRSRGVRGLRASGFRLGASS